MKRLLMTLVALSLAACASPTAPVQLQVPPKKTEPATCINPQTLPPGCQ